MIQLTVCYNCVSLSSVVFDRNNRHTLDTDFLTSISQLKKIVRKKYFKLELKIAFVQFFCTLYHLLGRLPLLQHHRVKEHAGGGK